MFMTTLEVFGMLILTLVGAVATWVALMFMYHLYKSTKED